MKIYEYLFIGIIKLIIMILLSLILTVLILLSLPVAWTKPMQSLIFNISDWLEDIT